ncbi:hypothetical protein NLI96_g9937 [Meripilus lineatus]|uniref:Uncharacterized protein n=1 Tax=Meripilus lineatus TaxID=2056292 RepID=A0AAD5YEU1_9APHY|nr:hypothetical protein NLI96_g9937 [Physisporinus lineatus]
MGEIKSSGYAREDREFHFDYFPTSKLRIVQANRDTERPVSAKIGKEAGTDVGMPNGSYDQLKALEFEAFQIHEKKINAGRS